MANLITMEAAAAIWKAHREIETAKKLLADLRDKKSNREDPTPIDAFGRRSAYQFGMPHGDSGHMLLDVSPELALHVIEAHITRKQLELVEHCARAALELSGDLPTVEPDGERSPSEPGANRAARQRGVEPIAAATEIQPR